MTISTFISVHPYNVPPVQRPVSPVRILVTHRSTSQLYPFVECKMGVHNVVNFSPILLKSSQNLEPTVLKILAILLRVICLEKQLSKLILF